MSKLFAKICLFLLITFFINNCTTTKVDHSGPETFPPLLVGVTPDYTPVIFKKGKEIAGIEAELARMLAMELGKPVKFIELRWDDQIPALLTGRIDIIMSGMSITGARKVRINFTDHYLKSGLVAMMHAEDTRKYSSIEDIKQYLLNVGVVKGTTSEEFVRKDFPNAMRIASFLNAGDAVTPLKNRSIDIFIHDAPSIMWLVSENETDLAGLWEPMNEEYLAWGVRRDDEALLMSVNNILAKWKQDGTLRRVLLSWLPLQYLELFK